MTNKRMEVLAKILEEEQLFKLAQTVGDGQGEIDKETADKLAQEIADKLLQEELAKLLG
jgi:hypothetical protein